MSKLDAREEVTKIILEACEKLQLASRRVKHEGHDLRFLAMDEDCPACHVLRAWRDCLDIVDVV